MASNPWVTTVTNVALILAVVGSAWLVLDTGVGETYDVITGDTANITAATNITYGSSVGFADRVITFGAVMTILVGIGAVSASSAGNNKLFRDLIKYMPLLVGVLGLIEFSSITSDMLNGSYDFDAFSDGQNALHLYVTGAVVGAVTSVIGMRQKDN